MSKVGLKDLVSAGSLHAFESPNCSPLVTVGISITVDTKSVWRAGTISALTVQSKLCRDVVLLRLFPSIRTETIRHFLTVQSKLCRDVVLLRLFPPIRTE